MYAISLLLLSCDLKKKNNNNYHFELLAEFFVESGKSVLLFLFLFL